MNVPFDALTREAALRHVMELLATEGSHHIATPNPEMLLAAQNDQEFLHILHGTKINIPDGIGIIWAANAKNDRIWKALLKLAILPCKKPRSPLPERVTGADMFLDICKHATHKHAKIFLLGGQAGVAEKTKQALEALYPNIQIVGTHAGSPSPYEEEKIKDLINDASPEILFVAYGAPAQEKWITRNLKKMPSIKIAMGVGGTFDYISGTLPRAPIFYQKTGLEWLYRLIKEPKRWRRIYNATVVFPRKFLKKE